jgi:uncharacterized protein YprB with RNaseH-like and TPR domain
MAGNLRDRLRRIRAAPRAPPAFPTPAPKTPPQGGTSPPDPPDSRGFGAEWTEGGYQTLRRRLILDLPLPAAFPLPAALPVLIPDLLRYGPGGAGALPGPEEFLFFDLETTGLSGGAGTVAFLAAFGRFVRASPGPGAAGPEDGAMLLRVDQYLLLDYGGEDDFLAALLREFEGPGPHGLRPPLAVTYNGKSFDFQILKSRCVMMGRPAAAYYPADLLHPARRLWKTILPSCSQGEIETSVLGLDRTGDVSGALAPDIWFSFLKTADPGPLLGICDHNRRDILGLAALFSALARIAEAPLAAGSQFRYDKEALALRWREALAKNADRDFGPAAARTGRALLTAAAAEGRPRAALVLALDLLHGGRAAEGRQRLLDIARGEAAGVYQAAAYRAAAYRALAVDAEWRLRLPAEALALAEEALLLEELGRAQEADFRCRRDRLLRRLEREG